MSFCSFLLVVGVMLALFSIKISGTKRTEPVVNKMGETERSRNK